MSDTTRAIAVLKHALKGGRTESGCVFIDADDLQEAISALEASQWVKCSERMPGADWVPAYVCCTDGEVIEAVWSGKQWFDTQFGEPILEAEHSTHWMPWPQLPAPPIVEQGGEVNKADYVVRQKSDGKHTCHWPGCGKVVPPALWGCKTHWFALPGRLRNAIWQTYVPGQEITKTPSDNYMKVAAAVDKWVREFKAAPPTAEHEEQENPESKWRHLAP